MFDDLIANIMSTKKIQTIIKELFIRCTKLNISLVVITQSYFSVPKDVRLDSKHYLIMRINNRKELQNIAIHHSADIDYNDFDTTLSASDPLRFRKNLLPSYKNDSN